MTPMVSPLKPKIKKTHKAIKNDMLIETSYVASK